MWIALTLSLAIAATITTETVCWAAIQIAITRYTHRLQVLQPDREKGRVLSTDPLKAPWLPSILREDSKRLIKNGEKIARSVSRPTAIRCDDITHWCSPLEGGQDPNHATAVSFQGGAGSQARHGQDFSAIVRCRPVQMRMQCCRSRAVQAHCGVGIGLGTGNADPSTTAGPACGGSTRMGERKILILGSLPPSLLAPKAFSLV